MGNKIEKRDSDRDCNIQIDRKGKVYVFEREREREREKERKKDRDSERKGERSLKRTISTMDFPDCDYIFCHESYFA